jgi:two-component system, OmpR family, sensor histidine kinase MtrB
MAGHRQPTLRGIVTITVVAVVALAAIVGMNLIAVTTSLHSATVELMAAVESVRITGEIELNLLQHTRETDSRAAGEIEAALRQRIQDAATHVTTDEEAAILRRVDHWIERYLASGDETVASPTTLDEAYAASDALMKVNLEQARSAVRNAEVWDRAANVVGVGVTCAVIAIGGVLLWWLSARAFRPTLAVAQAMERFAAGDRSARAEETGPRDLREMARRFNDMATELSARRERQMEFLAGVAHDLRNPLSTLSAAVGVLSAGLSSPQDASRMIQILQRQVGRLDRMVGDLLDITGIEAGRLDLTLAPCDLRTLVGEVVSMFRSTLSTHEILFSDPALPIRVRCDAHRIEQVLGNLIGNAVKYSPEGSRVHVAISADDRTVQISVADEGVGIAEEDRERLFEPFRRARSAARSSIPGTGLGLFVARRIVEAHGGHIELESGKGKGTTARIRLPSAPHEPVEMPEAETAGVVP